MNLQGSGSVALVTNTSGIEASQNTINANGNTPSAAGENLTTVFNNTLAQQLALLKQVDSATNGVITAGQTLVVTPAANAPASGISTPEANNFALPILSTVVTSAENVNALVLNPTLPLTQSPQAAQFAQGAATESAAVQNTTSINQNVTPVMNLTESLQQIKAAMSKLDGMELQQSQATQSSIADLNTVKQQLQEALQQVQQLLQQSKERQGGIQEQVQANQIQDSSAAQLQLSQELQQNVSNVSQALAATQAALQKIETALKSGAATTEQLPQAIDLRQNFAVSEGKTLPDMQKGKLNAQNSDPLDELNNTLAALTLALNQVAVANSKTTEATPVSTNPATLKKVSSETDNVLLTPAIPVQFDTQVITPAPESGSQAELKSQINNALVGSAALESQNSKLSQLIDKSISSSSITQTVTASQEIADPKYNGISTLTPGLNTGLNSTAVTSPLPEDIATSKQALNSLDSLSGLANAAQDSAAKELSNRVAADMAQLGQQLPVESKVSVPPMTKHVYSAEWNQELGSKIAWMTSQNISSADIKLNPEHLGPISIRIDMQNDQANISFTALNSGVKELLEASIPKLREMLGSQQLNLADVNVAQNAFSDQGQSSAQQNRPGQEGYRPPAQTQDNAMNIAGESEGVIDEVANQIEQSRAIVTQGIVSYYA